MLGDFINIAGVNSPFIYIGRILLIDTINNIETVFDSIEDLIDFLREGRKNYNWMKRQVYSHIDKDKLLGNQYHIKSMIGGKLLPYETFVKMLAKRIENDYTTNNLSIFALMQKYKVTCNFIFKNTTIENCYTFEGFFNKNVFITVKTEDMEYVFTNLSDFSEYCLKHKIGFYKSQRQPCVRPITVLNNIVLDKTYKQHKCHIKIYEI